MKPRRLRDHGKPARKRRVMRNVLRFSAPLTVDQVRALEAAWIDKGGRPVSVEFTPASQPKPWWNRWTR